MLAYAIPAAATWTLLGAILNLMPLQSVAVVASALYCAYYAVAEVTGIPALPAPGRPWQVTDSFVREVPRWRRLITWGALLGPGFATRNPYAGFGFLPLAVASLGSVDAGLAVGAIVGAVHGAARAIALVRDAHHVDAAEYLRSVLHSMYWRTADGLLLAFVAGLAAVTAVSQV